MKDKVLLVEDEVDLGNVVTQYLEAMEFEVLWCKTGEEAFARFKKDPTHFEIIVIDIRLPEMDGFELAENIVKLSDTTPFLFLTARKEKTDKIRGLKIGADDYITKPFDIDELVLRIKNIIRRNKSGAHHPVPHPDTISLGDIMLNADALQLSIGNSEPVLLTLREAQLLQYLMERPEKVLKREEILTQLWGENDYFLGRSLDVFISRLRKLLASSARIIINNVYGVGFIVNVKPGK